MIIEFTLPSDPEVKVSMREATVSDAIDFSAIDPTFEEEAITAFLKRLITNTPESHKDPQLWTGEDRMFALLSYHVNTTKYRDIPITYMCRHCKKEHTVSINLSAILEEYIPIEGKSFRDVVHDGHSIIVHPVRGIDLEAMESLRAQIHLHTNEIEKITDMTERKKFACHIRMLRGEMHMLRVLSTIDGKWLAPDSTEDSRREKVKEYILQMPSNDFHELFHKVGEKLEELHHGLNSIIDDDGKMLLISPPVQCEQHPNEEPVRLRFPFRCYDCIPHI